MIGCEVNSLPEKRV